MEYENKEVKLCEDGKYRWVYEMNMITNPTIFLTVFKIFFWIILIMWAVFGLILYVFPGDWEGLWGMTKAALVGMASGRPTAAGAGLLAASKNSSTSEFKLVKRVKAHRRLHVIKVNQLLNKNQVYVPDGDFDFVYDYIKSRCVNARK